MPNIPEYDAGNLALHPTEIGVEAAAADARTAGLFAGQLASAQRGLGQETSRVGWETEQLGSRTGQLGNEKEKEFKSLGNIANSDIQTAGDAYVNYLDHTQISNGSALFATKFAQLDDAWNKTISDPNIDPRDPTIAAKFNENQIQPTLEAMRESFTTEKSQDYAEKMIEQIRDHFNVKQSADMSTLANRALKLNISTLTNEFSNTAFNDPSSVKASLAMLETSIRAKVATSPNLRGLDAAEISNEVLFQSESAVVKAGAVGMIGKNPDAGLAEFSKPEWSKWIVPGELQQLTQQAKTVQSAMRTDEVRTAALQKQQQQAESDQREGQYIAKLHDDDPTVSGQVTAKAIANDFTLNREGRERMIGIVNRDMKPETDARVSAQSSVQIMKMIRDPNADPQAIRNAIFEARVKDPGTPGSITKADMADLQKQTDDVKTPQGAALAVDRNEFFKNYGPTIDPEMKLGNPTPLGAQGLYRAEKDARRQEQDLQRRGIDPHSLYDPASPYFFGKPATIGGYRPSLADQTAYERQLKADRSRPAASVNLTGNGTTVTGVQTLDIPAGMSPADAMKWAKGQGAKSVRLPDGRIGTVQ